MRFADIPGHEAVKSRLRQMADSGRIPHALLLEGPAGTGKMALARAFVQYVCCTDRQGGDSCGQCPSCLQHQSFNHIDTHYTYPTVLKGGSGSAPVSDDYAAQWRDYMHGRLYMDFDQWADSFGRRNAQPVIYVNESAALIHKLSFTSHRSPYKSVVLWMPERLNSDTANKLLKLIEEPYPDTIFVMVSDEPGKILPTIYSRLQRIEVKRLPDEEVAAYLTARHAIDPAEALMLAHNAEGSTTAALRMIDTRSDTHAFFEFFTRLMRLAYQRKIAELRGLASELAALGREKEIKFYDYCARLTRENFVYNFRVDKLNYMSREEQQFSVNFSRFINENNVEKIIATFDDARTDIAGNGNGKIINLDVAIKIILLLKQ